MKKAIIKLITRFIGARAVKFDGSRVYYWNVPMIVWPFENIALFEKELAKNFGARALDIVYYMARIHGENGTNILLRKYAVKPEVSDMRYFYEQMDFVGIGHAEDTQNTDAKNNIFEVSNKNSPNGIAHLDRFGKSEIPVCTFNRGLIAGGAYATTVAMNNNKEDLLCIETKCVAKGDKECIFNTKPISQQQNHKEHFKHLPIFDEMKKIETLSMLLRKPSKLAVPPETQLFYDLKKKYSYKAIQYIPGGIVKVFDVKGLITPIDVVVLIFHTLKRVYGKKVDNLLYRVGSDLGFNSAKSLIENYQYKQTDVKIKRSVEQIGIFGLGHPEFVKLDFKGLNIIKLYNGPAKHHLELFSKTKEFFDSFILGFICGVYENVLGRKVEGEEKECMARGQAACTFQIKA